MNASEFEKAKRQVEALSRAEAEKEGKRKAVIERLKEMGFENLKDADEAVADLDRKIEEDENKTEQLSQEIRKQLLELR